MITMLQILNNENQFPDIDIAIPDVESNINNQSDKQTEAIK